MSGNFTFCNTSSWEMERTSTLKITTNQAINLSILHLTFPLRQTKNRTPLYSANKIKKYQNKSCSTYEHCKWNSQRGKIPAKTHVRKDTQIQMQSINQSINKPYDEHEKSTLNSSKRHFCEFFPELHSHAQSCTVMHQQIDVNFALELRNL